MTLNDYQVMADSTAIYPDKGSIMGLVYTALGLGESGEVQGKVKKIIRDELNFVSPETALAIAMELGDQLWYISACAKELGYTLDEIAIMNIDKLISRQGRGVIGGSGDNR